jgi:DNA-binding CsgD family transcriptional regulator
MGENMNKRNVFQHLMQNDPVFRKKVASKAGALGMSLFNAAKACTAVVEQEQVGQMISQDQARALNGSNAKLTKKEQQVHDGMRKHKDVDKVAKHLKMKADSVRYHIRHIFNKTGEDMMLLAGKKLRHNRTPQTPQDGAVRSKASNGSSRYLNGSREEAIKRNAKVRDCIVVALKPGPATAGEIRKRLPKSVQEHLSLSKGAMGNAMTALKLEKSIRRKSGKGATTVWRLP